MCVCVSEAPYLDAVEVHGLLDDVMVVVKAEQRGVDGLVEGPGVRRMLLRQQLLQDPVAVAELGVQLAAAHWRRNQGIW